MQITGTLVHANTFLNTDIPLHSLRNILAHKCTLNFSGGNRLLYDSGVAFNKSLVLGITIPLVMLLVFWGVRTIHHRFIRMAKNQ